MKKLIVTLVTLIGLVMMTATGCSKKATVDTTSFQGAFQTAPATLKTQITNVVTAIKSNDYAGAEKILQDMQDKADLSPEQDAAVMELMSKLDTLTKK